VPTGVVAVLPWCVPFLKQERVSQRVLERKAVMNNLANYVRAKLGVNESGQDLLEYALLVALIALVSVGVIATAGTNVQTIFTKIGSALVP
jgi:Flp pilus assembly pilin Flp